MSEMTKQQDEGVAATLRAHRPSGWSCSCGWPLNDSVGSWVDHMETVLIPLMRCPTTDPVGEPCRLFRGHDGLHGDGLGIVWNNTPTPVRPEAGA